MTRGWSLLVSWKDGLLSDWMPLKEPKDSYPVQIAEYATANKIANEPAFNWWVHTVLRKRNRIVAKVKRYWRVTHKFGARLRKTVAEALAIDDETGTDFWLKELAKFTRNLLPRWVQMRVLPNNFDHTKDLEENDLVLGALMASDGSCSHAVTIHGSGLVFDANEFITLPLGKESLDYCTSTATITSEFVGTVQMGMVVPL